MLSGGMRQRVALMRTLIMEPEILLMDEPFGALDTHTKLEMHKTLLEIWERERQTVLFVTHDLGEALTLASRIILLSARPGRLKEDFDVTFPRPRDAVALRETAEFGRLYSHIWHSLGEEFRRHRRRSAAMARRPASRSCSGSWPSWRRRSRSGSGGLTVARRAAEAVGAEDPRPLLHLQAVGDLAKLPEARLPLGPGGLRWPASARTPTISGSPRSSR